MVIKIRPLFFINNTRSKEIKKRLIELNEHWESIEDTKREPVTNIYRHRVSAKYQELVEDYYTLIDEFNAAREREALMIEALIGVLWVVDYSTNPDINDELFSRLSKELRRD